MKKRTACILIVTVIVALCIAIGAFALSIMDKPNEVLKYIVGLSDEAPEYADANGDGKVNVLDVIYLIKNAKIVLTNADSGNTLTSKDVLEIANGKELQLNAVSTVSDEEVLTWQISDSKVAYVDQTGKVTAINPGECTVTVKGTSGMSESVGFVVYETVAEEITYRWDFNDLTETNHGNDLTLNPSLPANAANNYSFVDGVYVANTSATTYERPDFVLETPITVDNTRDFTVEWRGTMPTGTGHTVLDKTPLIRRTIILQTDIFIFLPVQTGRIPTQLTRLNLCQKAEARSYCLIPIILMLWSLPTSLLGRSFTLPPQRR